MPAPPAPGTAAAHPCPSSVFANDPFDRPSALGVGPGLLGFLVGLPCDRNATLSSAKRQRKPRNQHRGNASKGGERNSCVALTLALGVQLALVCVGLGGGELEELRVPPGTQTQLLQQQLMQRPPRLLGRNCCAGSGERCSGCAKWATGPVAPRGGAGGAGFSRWAKSHFMVCRCGWGRSEGRREPITESSRPCVDLDRDFSIRLSPAATRSGLNP